MHQHRSCVYDIACPECNSRENTDFLSIGHSIINFGEWMKYILRLIWRTGETYTLKSTLEHLGLKDAILVVMKNKTE